ncbi:MAG: RNA polymerase sigma factor [Bacteroidota bacterium]
MTKNKQEEFLKLYEPVHERFERFCRVRVYGNMDFRDLINETLLLAFEKMETLRSKDAFLHFLFGISIRILANSNKKKKEEGIKSEQDFIHLKDSGISPETQTDFHFLYQALSKLPIEQGESLILFEIAGFSIKEIADLHQASESAVKQRLKRGREKLAEILTFETSLKMGELNHE